MLHTCHHGPFSLLLYGASENYSYPFNVFTYCHVTTTNFTLKNTFKSSFFFQIYITDLLKMILKDTKYSVFLCLLFIVEATTLLNNGKKPK